MSTPSGTMTSCASTDLCGPCGFGDNDGFPWADASVSTTTGSSATIATGVLTGSLWDLGNGWAPTASVDHDPLGGGIVSTSAQVTIPALRVFDLDNAPAGFDGAVKVGAFTAKATAQAGYTLVAPDVATGTTTKQLQLWDGAGYRAVSIAASAAVDTSAAATFTVGDRTVSYTTHVQAQPSTFATVATAPRTDAAAQHPSILVITVDVTISTVPLTEPTTTSSTSTTVAGATTTTVAPEPIVTDSFTITVDYGRASAHSAWLAKGP